MGEAYLRVIGSKYYITARATKLGQHILPVLYVRTLDSADVEVGVG